MALTYRGPEPWDGEVILACLRQRMADPFIDPEGTRTYLFRQDGPVTVNAIIKGQFPAHRMTGGSVSAEPGPKSLAHPLMTTLSADGRYAVAIAFAGSTSCSGNFGPIHCIHSNPRIANLQPGETRVLRGRVYCLPVRGPQDVLDRWLRDAPSL